jgi:hypothetical protein
VKFTSPLYKRSPANRPDNPWPPGIESVVLARPQATFHLPLELIRTLLGRDSMLLYHRRVNGLLAAETMTIDDDGRSIPFRVHYVKD